MEMKEKLAIINKRIGELNKCIGDIKRKKTKKINYLDSKRYELYNDDERVESIKLKIAETNRLYDNYEFYLRENLNALDKEKFDILDYFSKFAIFDLGTIGEIFAQIQNVLTNNEWVLEVEKKYLILRCGDEIIRIINVINPVLMEFNPIDLDYYFRSDVLIDINSYPTIFLRSFIYYVVSYRCENGLEDISIDELNELKDDFLELCQQSSRERKKY